jgi:hypothetical protein
MNLGFKTSLIGFMIKVDFLIKEENLLGWLGMLMFGKKVMARKLF